MLAESFCKTWCNSYGPERTCGRLNHFSSVAKHCLAIMVAQYTCWRAGRRWKIELILCQWGKRFYLRLTKIESRNKWERSIAKGLATNRIKGTRAVFSGLCYSFLQLQFLGISLSVLVSQLPSWGFFLGRR